MGALIQNLKKEQKVEVRRRAYSKMDKIGEEERRKRE
jgi:hypothetical protein